MRVFWIAALCLVCSAPAFTQSSDSEPPSRDDVMLYMQTMHSHDMVQRIMEVQAQSMRQLLQGMLKTEKGTVPVNFDEFFKKAIDELIKNMPADEIVQASIPAYQHHFTKGDIKAMNTFYSSPVGQKVLAELPEVMQESNKAMMPILTKYLGEWKERLQQELEETYKTPTPSQKDSTKN